MIAGGIDSGCGIDAYGWGVTLDGAAERTAGECSRKSRGFKNRRPQPMAPQGGGLPLAAHGPGPAGRTVSLCTGPQISAGHPVHARGLQNARPVLPGAGQKRGAGLRTFGPKSARDPTGGAPYPLPCRGGAAADLPYRSGTPDGLAGQTPKRVGDPSNGARRRDPWNARGLTGRMQNAREARRPPVFL